MATMICLTCHEVIGRLNVKGTMKSMSTKSRHTFAIIAKHNRIEGIEAKA